MSEQKEMKFLLLLSSMDLSPSSEKPLMEKDVLDNIENKKWVKLSENDLAESNGHNKPKWRHDFSRERLSLVMDGHFPNDGKDWRITEKGKAALNGLYSELLNNGSFKTVTESCLQFAKDLLSPSDMKIDENLVESIDRIADAVWYIDGKDRMSLVKLRVNQSIIKDIALKVHGSRCAVCGSSLKQMLIASHIKEWSESTPFEKGDPYNILILCPNHDSLFDKHLITFGDDGRIIIGEEINDDEKRLFNIKSDSAITMNEQTKKYMRFHRNVFHTGRSGNGTI